MNKTELAVAVNTAIRTEAVDAAAREGQKWALVNEVYHGLRDAPGLSDALASKFAQTLVEGCERTLRSIAERSGSRISDEVVANLLPEIVAKVWPDFLRETIAPFDTTEKTAKILSRGGGV